MKKEKSISCPLCRSKRLKYLTDKVRFGKNADIYFCQDCTLTFLDQKSLDFPKDFYEKEYHQTYITHVEPSALNPQNYYDKMIKATEIWAGKFNQMLTGKEVVLDLGCSTGHFINQVKERTRKIYGSDLNLKEVEFCKETLKLDVSNEPLEKRFKDGTFDYISMIFVLEHIAEPQEFLLKIKKLLNPEGKLVILVPNIQDALVNFYDLPEFRDFYFCMEHLFYFNPETLGRLFNEVGMESDIEVIQEYPITNHLNWAYYRKPSDTLAARKTVPNVPLSDKAPIGKWDDLWAEFNLKYKEFLKESGFGDRIWCIAKNK